MQRLTTTICALAAMITVAYGGPTTYSSDKETKQYLLEALATLLDTSPGSPYTVEGVRGWRVERRGSRVATIADPPRLDVRWSEAPGHTRPDPVQITRALAGAGNGGSTVGRLQPELIGGFGGFYCRRVGLKVCRREWVRQSQRIKRTLSGDLDSNGDGIAYSQVGWTCGDVH